MNTIPIIRVDAEMESATALASLFSVTRYGAFWENDAYLLNPNDLVTGGQPAAHALAAACAHRPDAAPTSLHVLLINSPDTRFAYRLTIDQLRLGRQTSQYSVRGAQDGTTLVHAGVILSVKATQSVHTFADYMPPEPSGNDPEQLPSRRELLAQFESSIHPVDRILLTTYPFIDIREIGGAERLRAPSATSRIAYWLRVPAAEALPPREHYALFTLISDYWYSAPFFSPYREQQEIKGSAYTASLDHTIWFHSPPNCAEWMYVCVDTLGIVADKCLMQASYLTRAGRLVATVSQHALIKAFRKK